jgi:hypothetical protein
MPSRLHLVLASLLVLGGCATAISEQATYRGAAPAVATASTASAREAPRIGELAVGESPPTAPSDHVATDTHEQRQHAVAEPDSGSDRAPEPELAEPAVTALVEPTRTVEDPAESPAGSSEAAPAVEAAGALAGPFPYGEGNAVAGPPVLGRRATTLRELQVRPDGLATEIVLRADGELAFAAFRLDRPERFVLDLEGVADRTGLASRVVGRTFVVRVSVAERGEAAGSTRVVLDLIRPVDPLVMRRGDRLVVRVEP